MAIYDLSPTPQSATSINVAEDVRGPSTPIIGSPFSVSTTGVTILPANGSRASASIINTGSITAFLREGTIPITTSSFSLILPPNRMWEPDTNFRFTGPMQAITPSGTAILAVSESVIII